MQQFASAAKKHLAKLIIVAKSFFNAAKGFCTNVIPFVVSKIVSYLKKSPRVVAAIITVVLVLSCTVTVAVATKATSAYAVVYNGETIAMVKEPAVLAEAEIFAANKLNNPICTSHLIKTNLTQTLAGENNLVGSNALADRIINYSDDIVIAKVLKVEDKVVAFGDSYEAINSSLEEYLLDYKQTNGVDNVEFFNDYEIADIYILKSELAGIPNIEGYLNSTNNTLSVQTVSTVVVTEGVDFETVKTETGKLSAGTEKITQKGVKGTKEVTYKVFTLDGVQTKKTVMSTKVITEPVAQKVLVGTKRVVAADKNGDASMCWPVKRVARSYVSSYVGDGRGHKGMDIVAPAGTPIYAAVGGTVTYSGWDTSGYGYKIVIKHSNGYETLYAHCSALYVKKGDTVAMGETIGAVGTTGRSTGNHLHFEVHKDGRIKDPALYIGRD